MSIEQSSAATVIPAERGFTLLRYLAPRRDRAETLRASPVIAWRITADGAVAIGPEPDSSWPNNLIAVQFPSGEITDGSGEYYTDRDDWLVLCRQVTGAPDPDPDPPRARGNFDNIVNIANP